MKIRNKKIPALILSGLCCLAVISGCGGEGKTGSEENSPSDTAPVQESAETEGQQDGAESSAADAGNIGEFSVQDINGETYTQEMFADYDLTMVNIFATWCSPCVGEIPDLQKLWEEMEGKGVGVVGIVLDAIDVDGNVSEDTIETAKVLAEYTGAKYPFLIPDKGGLNGRVSEVSAVPETFFVDSEGKIVGETYTGSRSLEEWKQIVETELKGVGQ